MVRLSGPGCETLCRAITGRLPAPRHASYASFRNADDSVIDQGLAIYFAGPRSYTGEDVLELQGHGGPAVMQALLGRCLELGARLAEPGEFTRRAFLNGRLDLAQAESVADLIEASTQAAARSAARSLSGEFSRLVHGLADELVELRALVEATLDFPEEEVEFIESARVAERVARLLEALARLADQAGQGRLLRDGMQVVLAGRPNVGKSSLLNCLAGEERAIVSAVAGTTRDVLRESIHINGVPLHLVDTAGVRVTEDEVEALGVARSWKEIHRADAVLLLLDAAEGWTEADEAVFAGLPAGVPVVVVWNKLDLPGARAAGAPAAGIARELRISARTGQGLEAVKDALLSLAGWHTGNEGVFLARERHVQALARTRQHVQAAMAALGQLEILAEELRVGHEALCSITGEFTPDDLLGEIFSRFCIGK